MNSFDDVVERAQREIDQGLLPSCQLAIAKDGEVVARATLGNATHGDDSRYVMFSATKAIVASTIWQLLAEGSLALEDRVADHIPEFGTNGKDAVTVEQVLLHTSGFPRAPLGPPAWHDREARVRTFSKWQLNWEPGTRYEYHPTSAHWVLAELLARLDDRDHRDAITARVLEPLGLTQLRVGVPENEQANLQRVSPTGEPATPDEIEAVLGVREIPVGEVTEEALLGFAEPANVAAGVPGGGGVTNASDLVLFYQALLHNQAGLWDPKWLAIATGDVRNTFPDPLTGVATSRTIGLLRAGDDDKGVWRGFGHGNSPATFGHNGAGGQLAWADPETGVSFAYLTNGLDRHILRQVRRDVALSSRAAGIR